MSPIIVKKKITPFNQIINDNNIPYAGGLGSSAASISGGLFIGNYLSGSKLSYEDLMQMAVAIEGHPDNATPCIFLIIY